MYGVCCVLCAAHHPNINAAVELLRQGFFFSVITCIFIILLSSISSIYLASPQHYPGITELDVEPFLEDEGTGNLRYVQVNRL
jgi:excinuclease UvrABC helicase subunit UvrB